jgi:nicotinate-nucleotide adenylyltransferase
VRLGLFGGTFDPIHRGHIALARSVRDLFDLNRLLLLPAWVPPHKLGAEVSEWRHRFAMAELACGEVDRVEPSGLEGSRPGPSYTVETLEQFRAELATSDPLLFLMGADSLAELASWKDHRRILDLANLVVAPRAGADRAAILAGLDAEARERVVVVGPPGADAAVPVPAAGRIYWVDLPLVQISGRDIRRRVSAGTSIGGLVPETVEAYISKYELYTGRDRSPSE